MSFSTPNFEIRREYQERLPRVRVRTRNEDDEDLEAFAEIGGFFLQVFAYGCTLVVLLFAAVIVVAIVGWLWSFTQTPPRQQLTERIQHVQEAVRGTISTASNGGGRRAASPSPTQQRGDSSGRAEEVAQDQVVQPVEEKEKGASAPAFYADTKPMAYGVVDYAGEFPADGSLSRGGPDWLSRKDLVFGAEVPSRCSGERFRIPAGRTASVYRAETGRTSLDTRYGPAALVLREGYCMETGSIHICVMCGSSY